MYVTIFGGGKNITDSKEYLETIEIGRFLKILFCNLVS